MSQTIQQIVNRAARKLGKLPIGQNLQPEWNEDLTQAYSEVYALLDAESLVTWASDGAIPDEYANQVACLVAATRVDEAGVSTERYQRIVASGRAALPAIASIKSGEWFNPREVTDY